MTKPMKKQLDWEKEFDKLTDKLFGLNQINTWKYREKKLKQFIQQTLTSDRQRVVEEIDGMKLPTEKDESNSDWFYGYGYNCAITDIIKILNKQ